MFIQFSAEIISMKFFECETIRTGRKLSFVHTMWVLFSWSTNKIAINIYRKFIIPFRCIGNLRAFVNIYGKHKIKLFNSFTAKVKLFKATYKKNQASQIMRHTAFTHSRLSQYHNPEGFQRPQISKFHQSWIYSRHSIDDLLEKNVWFCSPNFTKKLFARLKIKLIFARRLTVMFYSSFLLLSLECRNFSQNSLVMFSNHQFSFMFKIYLFLHIKIFHKKNFTT